MRKEIERLIFYFQIIILYLSFYICKIYIKQKNDWVIGVDEIASQIHFLSNVLNSSVTVSLYKHNFYKLNYNYSINITNKYIKFLIRVFYAPMLLGYLVNRSSKFWYIGNTGFLLNRKYEFYFLKKLNKTIICMFVGSDIRSPKLSLEYTRNINIDNFISYTQKENSKEFLFNDLKVEKTANTADLYADLIFSFKFDQISYIKNKQFPWPYMYPKEKFLKNDNKFNRLKKIKIVHAPSNPFVKGTPLVRAAIKKLELEDYNFEYVELENLSNEIVLKHLNSAHIVLNQFYGFDISLGLLAIEAMANHTALMMSYEPDAIKHYDIELERFDKCLLNTKYWEVYDNLKYLLDNPEKIKYYADNGYEFAYRYYTYEAATKYVNKVLEDNGIID